MASTDLDRRALQEEDDGEEDDDETGEWEDWTDAAAEDDAGVDAVCLFCDRRESSATAVFHHCSVDHHFDFATIRKDCGLGFYDSLKLLNFVRSSVAAQFCWQCGCSYQSQQGLIDHLNAGNHGFALAPRIIPGKQVEAAPWNDDKYLTPFLKNDPLLYSLEYEDEDEEDFDLIDKSRVISELSSGIFDMTDDADNNIFTGLTSGFNTMHNVGLHDADGVVGMPTDSNCRLDILNASDFQLAKVSCSDNCKAVYPCNSSEPLQAKDIHTFSSNNLDEMVDHFQEGAALKEIADLKIDQMNGSCHSHELDQHVIPEIVPSGRKKNGLKVSFASVADKEVRNVNQSYFKSYGEFGIHREMLSDKVRTEAYRDAILHNPALFNNAVVLDVGCGTGILSLFAAQAGASKVIAVDGSDKMVSVAREVAKVNGFLRGENGAEGIISVVEGMIEELDLPVPVGVQGVDVLVSEWMGYCLLFESMLSSVLHARDRWLKPDGAILPDRAIMYVAGFGKGGSSLSFWENVYGFNMQCIGEEVHQNASEFPIVDTLDGKDVITNSCIIQVFDLKTMKEEDVDFTAEFHLSLMPLSECQGGDNGSKCPSTNSSGGTEVAKCISDLCYGLVVWFDTSFSDRFCENRPILLSTSPLQPKTHWSQTLLTFKKPIALCQPSNAFNDCIELDLLGTEKCPATELSGRISIARSSRHRSIDISLETSAVGRDGKRKVFPVQMFDI